MRKEMTNEEVKMWFHFKNYNGNQMYGWMPYKSDDMKKVKPYVEWYEGLHDVLEELNRKQYFVNDEFKVHLEYAKQSLINCQKQTETELVEVIKSITPDWKPFCDDAKKGCWNCICEKNGLPF